MKKSLVIFTHGGGRLANQIINHAHLIACQETNKESIEVINLGMGPFNGLFEAMLANGIPTMPRELKRMSNFRKLIAKIVEPRDYRMSLFNQVLRFIHMVALLLPWLQSVKIGSAPGYLAFLPGKTFKKMDLGDEETLTLLQNRRITLIAGWPIRSWDLFKLHQRSIREAFRIKQEYAQNAVRYISEIRSKHDLVIGILMRQDDYRTWVGGKYFFENEIYHRWMKEIEGIFSNESVAFVIASDEKKNLEDFSQVTAYLCTGQAVGSSHFIESMAELSLCDYVMTPPSTFGVWAGFMGDVPVIPLCAKDQKLDKSQFLNNHIFGCLDHQDMSISVK
ncbi:MAG: hypothetical protein ACI83W_001150 [Marinoscillum sp.]|jgi:hypothetical protein